MYQDLITRHDWPVKKAIVEVPIRLKGHSKRIFINSLGSLGLLERRDRAKDKNGVLSAGKVSLNFAT